MVTSLSFLLFCQWVGGGGARSLFLDEINTSQGCHVSGKSQGKTKFSPGQGIVREF